MEDRDTLTLEIYDMWVWYRCHHISDVRMTKYNGQSLFQPFEGDCY